MNKKLFKMIIVSFILMFVFAITIYAAFTMTHNYEAEIEYHEIKNTTLSNEVENAKVSFTHPGDKINVTYSLKNSDDREYQYYYSFETESNESKYFDMIYVYQNDEYCGVLRDYVGSNLVEKKNLPFNEYIFNGETKDTKFTFELHNEASSYVSNGLSIEIKIVAHLSTTNVKEIIFADNSNFAKAIQDAERSENITVVLKEDITTNIVSISKSCVIDLCGNELSLSSVVNIGEGVDLNIIDSRTGGQVTGEGFNISSESSFVELNAPVSTITSKVYNSSRLTEELDEFYAINNTIKASEDFDVLGYYKAYGITVSSDEVTIVDGVVKSTTLNTNKVVAITVNNKTYEFRYIGNDSTVIANILDNHLKHLSSFEAEANGLQVQHDLFLPTAIKEYNATISWHSSNQKVLSNDGIILEGQGNILLTATIKVYDIVFVQNYYIYIVQPDNLSKLQYLIAKVEQGFTLDNNTPDDKTDDIIYDVILSSVGQYKYLPVAGNTSLEHHYSLWTGDVKLGITDIKYSLEATYQYLTLNQELNGEVVTEASIGLNNITYSKAARVLITATFDNGEVLTSYIVITINLGESSLADEVYDDVQIELNKVDVLQNILDTRAENGVLNESGDFIIPAKIDIIKLQYTSLNTNLYSIQTNYVKDEQGNYTTEVESYTVHFEDLKYLNLSDSNIQIQCQIVVDSIDEEGNIEETVINPKVLYFNVPGAITSNNFVSSKIVNGALVEEKILDFSNTKIETLFYSIKLQTLQQAGCEYYDKTNNIKLVDVTDPAVIKGLGQYILIDDIDHVNKLMFEFGRNETILNYYDINILSEIIAWATDDDGAKVKVENSSFSGSIAANLLWLSSDGTTSISDEEVVVILSYTERYPGFKEIWDTVFNPLDNELTDDEISEMIEALAQDKTYTSILKWAIKTNSSVPLEQWLLIIDEESEYYNAGLSEITDSDKAQLAENMNIPVGFFDELENDGTSNITNDEERLIVYYVLSNHPEKYSAFITEWKTNVTRNTDDSSYINDINKNGEQVQYVYAEGTSKNSSTAIWKTLNQCYDPFFMQVLKWINYSEAKSVGENVGTFGGCLDENAKKLFTDSELGLPLNWYRFDAYDTILGFIPTNNNTFYSNYVTLDEWSILVKYLRTYYNITSIVLDGNPFDIDNNQNNPIVQVLSVTFDKDEDNTNRLSVAKASSAYNVAACIYEYGNKGYDNDPSKSPYSPQLTLEFMNALIDAVNAKYQNVSVYNSYVEDIKDATHTNITSSHKISDAVLSGNKIKDYTEEISIDEYEVVTEYLSNMVLVNVLGELKNVLIDYYVSPDIDMTLQPQNMDEAYNDILSTVNDVGNFDEIIENITTLGDDIPKDGEYDDNLPTVSPGEIEELIKVAIENTNFIKAIKDAFNAYSIVVENGNITITPVTTGDYDRTLSNADLAAIQNALKQELEFSGDERYTHISMSKITENETETFKMLGYFDNLTELSFRGSGAYYLFDSNESANGVFNVIALSCEKLEKLTMNYCGVSDISSITSLLNLTHLNLRSNYSKEEENESVTVKYDGLENVSSLIELNDLKNINNTDYFEYVNVYNTDVTTNRAQIVLGKLYEENNDAKLWLDVFGVETTYPFEDYLDNNKMAIYALSLLFELEKLQNNYIILPGKVYRQDGENVDNQGNGIPLSYAVTWKVVIANSLVKISNKSGYLYLERLSNAGGEVTISASITVGDVTETRYFVIDVSSLS